MSTQRAVQSLSGTFCGLHSGGFSFEALAKTLGGTCRD